MILGLVGIFFVQTFFVYTDPEGRRSPPLSEIAGRGQVLWHKNNCQSCHQLYGFGGFLGPDLTNAVEHVAPTRLELILTEGSERMPAFWLSPAERLAVVTFLEEVGRSGVSDPKHGKQLPVRELLEGLVRSAADQEVALTETERAGCEIVLEQNCIDCHLPNGRSAFRAPDLTRAMTDAGPERVHAVLTDGVPSKGMPRLGLSRGDRESVLAFLVFLERNGAPIRDGFRAAEKRSDGAIPLPSWFEYPAR